MKTLLLMIYLLNISHLSESYGDWQHPHYSFRCLESEKVELFGVHPNSKVKICGAEGNTTCDPIKEGGVFSIKYSCMNYSGKQYSAIVSVKDGKFDDVSLGNTCFSKPLTTSAPPSHPRRKRGAGTSTTTAPTTTASTTTAKTTTAPTTTTTSSYVGGHSHHEFLITCKEIPEKGINKTVAHVFQEKDFNKLPDNNKEVAQVEMYFKAVNNKESPDISTIYIGDEFYMFIKYMGEEQYNVIPEECTAFDEPWIAKGPSIKLSDTKKWVELWNIYNKTLPTNKGECAKHTELLENFYIYNANDTRVIYAKMYGFRFQEKKYITITCRVTIYKTVDASRK